MNTFFRARSALLTSVIAIPTLILTSASVYAASSGDTTVTLNVNASGTPAGGGTVPGYLTISAPASLNLGSSVAFPGSLTVPLGSAITVSDARALASVPVGWASSVIMSDLMPTTGTNISASVFSYDPGIITSVGTGAVLGIPASSVVLATTVVTATATVTRATWTPTLTISEPAIPANGLYTGTMTSSVY